jgi:hypothetical protein
VRIRDSIKRALPASAPYPGGHRPEEAPDEVHFADEATDQG